MYFLKSMLLMLMLNLTSLMLRTLERNIILKAFDKIYFHICMFNNKPSQVIYGSFVISLFFISSKYSPAFPYQLIWINFVPFKNAECSSIL